MAADAILDIQNFKFLTAGTVMGSNCTSVPNFVKIGWTAAEIWRFFEFFHDGGRPPSWICNACVGNTHEGHLVVFITVQNLVGINAVVLIICTFFEFRVFGLKTPIHAQIGVFDPLNGVQCEKKSPKGTSLRESASLEPSCVKIRRRVWPVGEFLKKASIKIFFYISPMCPEVPRGRICT